MTTAVAKMTSTPMDMISTAMEKGLTGEDLQRMMDLSERWEEREAKKAFNLALSEFKKNPPKITKERNVSFGNTSYNHASHAQVNEVIGAALAEHDISHRFEVEQTDRITVTCVLTHLKGHSERVSMSCAPDDSGKKNNIQAIGSAVTYLQRYTLQSATGIAAHDIGDQDGWTPVECITESQSLDVEALAAEVGADVPKMLTYFKIKAIAEIPAARMHDVVSMLESKRKA